jgi:hypothetical protein
MRFRKLRIAWSVGWGIICVLLIVLWVRSYENQAPRSSDWNSKRLPKGNENPGRIFTAMSSYGSIQLSTARWDGFNWTIEQVERKDTFLGFWHLQRYVLLERQDSTLVSRRDHRCVCRRCVAILDHALQPACSANRHDAGCRGAGADRVAEPSLASRQPRTPQP